MSLIAKEDLYYTDYSWVATYVNDDPKITGKPDSTELNRREGYEILYFINKVSEIWSFKQKNSAIKVEQMIRNEVPKEIRSQEKIKEWISENWPKSKY
ncbi:MAG: hypothetical protein WCK78_17620 [Paludibacter sp.]